MSPASGYARDSREGKLNVDATPPRWSSRSRTKEVASPELWCIRLLHWMR